MKRVPQKVLPGGETIKREDAAIELEAPRETTVKQIIKQML